MDSIQPTKFFKTLKANNYRGLSGFRSGDFGFINIVGGLNGAGKTTLLEALFTVVDFRDPHALLKPASWRLLSGSVVANSAALFSHGDLNGIATIEAQTERGTIKLEIVYEPQMLLEISNIPRPENSQQQSQSPLGLTLRIQINGENEDTLHLLDAGLNSIQARREGPGTQVMPRCMYLSRKTVDIPGDLTSRYSNCVSRKEKGRLLAAARVVLPELIDLTILQMDGISVLCGSVEPEVYLPVSFLGDGASATLSAASAILDCRGGALFLDEFDAAIHYSRMPKVWTALMQLARECNCQIFAATHSRETIAAAAEAAAKSGLTDDFKYMRLDRIDGNVSTTQYSFEEIKDALEEGWEVR